MTNQNSELVERVAKAINDATVKSWADIPNPMENVEKIRELQAQAAITACHAEELVEALELLCEAKDLKDTYGDCAAYRAVKQRGWAKARELLARINKPSEQPA